MKNFLKKDWISFTSCFSDWIRPAIPKSVSHIGESHRRGLGDGDTSRGVGRVEVVPFIPETQRGAITVPLTHLH